MPTERGVLATFEEPWRAAAAIRALRAAGVGTVQVAMPAPFPEVVEAIGRPRSGLAFVTLPGAALGLLGGVALTVGGSLAWPLVVGGKPPAAVPAFVVVIFELTVLVGSLVNLGAVAATTRRGGATGRFPAHARFNGDRIGVFVPGGGEEAARLLAGQGAEEVEHVG
ncbi:MAG TPA: quinol:electron acceptor oxidoreductase subunit ActD [Anaeromyxobacteraceae bacterium]|nr:quinol:electron acceptor oxidoreductase subunit ActD [Anaeromyxobacteraceae bacterium]